MMTALYGHHVLGLRGITQSTASGRSPDFLRAAIVIAAGRCADSTLAGRALKTVTGGGDTIAFLGVASLENNVVTCGLAACFLKHERAYTHSLQQGRNNKAVIRTVLWQLRCMRGHEYN